MWNSIFVQRFTKRTNRKSRMEVFFWYAHTHTQIVKISLCLLWLLRALIPINATEKSRFVCYPHYSELSSIWVIWVKKNRWCSCVFHTQCRFVSMKFITERKIGRGWGRIIMCILWCICSIFFSAFVAHTLLFNPIVPDVFETSRKVCKPPINCVVLFLINSRGTTSNTYMRIENSKHLCIHLKEYVQFEQGI